MLAPVVTLKNIPFHPEALKQLRLIAKERGWTVEAVVSDFINEVLEIDDGTRYKFTEKEERQLEQAERDIKEGRFITWDDFQKKLKQSR